MRGRTLCSESNLGMLMAIVFSSTVLKSRIFLWWFNSVRNVFASGFTLKIGGYSARVSWFKTHAVEIDRVNERGTSFRLRTHATAHMAARKRNRKGLETNDHHSGAGNRFRRLTATVCSTKTNVNPAIPHRRYGLYRESSAFSNYMVVV